MKNKFIYSEIWLLTKMAAFQRAGIYVDNVSNEKKIKFSNALQSYVKDEVAPKYEAIISEKEHLFNIWALSELSGKFSTILNNDKLNFGVAQKMLNLYLKYMWCLGKIKAPVHFPVDRRIQKEMKLKVIPWTKMSGTKGEKEYLSVINHAKELLQKCTYKNIAELELHLFSRKS